MRWSFKHYLVTPECYERDFMMYLSGDTEATFWVWLGKAYLSLPCPQLNVIVETPADIHFEISGLQCYV